MDSFEDLVATVLDRRGYWTRKSVKVKLTREDKQAIHRPSSPRWEIDVVAYSGRLNELLVVECKSYLDSAGVQLKSFQDPGETHYKLFSDEVLRSVVFSRLEAQLVEQGFCPPGVKVQLCLAAGNIHRDAAPVHDIFKTKGWKLFDRDWLVSGLRDLADESYENSVASVVAKLLLRKRSYRVRP